MIRGTTAPFKFEVPYDTNTIVAILATFYQKHWQGTDVARLPIEKWYIASKTSQEYGGIQVTETRNDGFAFSKTNPKEIQTSLTEEETLRFSDQEKAYVQIKVQFETAEGIITRASLPQKIPVYPILNDSPIGVPNPSDVIGDMFVFDAGQINTLASSTSEDTRRFDAGQIEVGE